VCAERLGGHGARQQGSTHIHPEASPPLLVDAAHGSGVGELVVRICGEVDLLTHRWLKTALDNLVLDDVTSVRVLLSDLAFCDARGMRMLIEFVRSGRRSGRRVEIECASPLVQTMLTIQDPSLIPQSRLVGGLAS
jgi:anti-anti-sigma factor